jgi:Transposase DDE domain
VSRLHSAFQHTDSLWQVRKRKITTAAIFSDLSTASKYKRGLNHILKAEDTKYTAQALGLARKKLPRHTFSDINRHLQSTSQSNRVFAVDGSKVHVHSSYSKDGCKSRTNDQPVSRPAVRLLIMLSSLFDVHTCVCYDPIVSTHFNERTSAAQHMQRVNRGDTLIFDRGYYSRALLQEADKLGLKVVFRLKIDAFKGVRQFFRSSRTTAKFLHQDTEGVVRTAYLHKYCIDQKVYVCLTNYMTTINEVKHLYKLR